METMWAIVILLIAIGGLSTAFTSAKRDFRGLFLPKKFAELGTLKGRTKAEIIDYVGDPTSVDFQGEGKELLQWISKEYHIALLFEGDTCLGVTHESTFKY